MGTYKSKQHKNTILIVDDDRLNREVLKRIFSSAYSFLEAADGKRGLEIIEKMQQELCAVILDVQMPEMTGMELLNILHSRGITEKIPIFLITMHDDEKIVKEAYMLGVMDFINKPVSEFLIQRRVETVIELFRTRERLSETVKGQEQKLLENAKTIEELHRGTLEILAAAIEFRDVETGHHTSRIYKMTKYILENTSMGSGFSDEDIEYMARASIMHDVGKIAISDVILNKPAKLTDEEFEIMKLHTVKGAELLGQISHIHSHPLYVYAEDIARHHHERWDGKGYPDRLCGDEISVSAQVVSIVDVYDALVSERVYKKSFSADVAVEMIKNGECGAFNPKLLKCFLQAEPEMRRWYQENEMS